MKVGDRVEAGRKGTEDWDTGRILEVEGEMALVAWDSGVRMEIPLAELRPLEGGK